MFGKTKFYLLSLSLLNWASLQGCTLSSDPSGFVYPRQVCGLVRALKARTVKNNKLLLQGSYGTGKSTLAKLLAKETNREIIEVRCSELVGMFVGDASRKIAEYIEHAKMLHRKTGKDVIFHFDEVDAIAHKITTENQVNHEQRASGLQTLWQNLDKYNPNSNTSSEDEEFKKAFFFIFSTNRYNDLEPVFLSRFQKTLILQNPDTANRKRMTQFYAKENNIDGYLKEKEINKITKKTKDMSLRSLEQIIAAVAERSEDCNCFEGKFIDEEVKVVEDFEKSRIKSEKEILNKNRPSSSKLVLKCTALSVILTQVINRSPQIYSAFLEKLPQLCGALRHYAPGLTKWVIVSGRKVASVAWYLCKLKAGGL